MSSDFVAAVNWIFSALLSIGNLMSSVWLLQLFLSLGLLLLVWKIYDLLR